MSGGVLGPSPRRRGLPAGAAELLDALERLRARAVAGQVADCDSPGPLLMALLAGDVAALAVRAMEADGLLGWVLPELAACRGFWPGGPHRSDVLDHALCVLDAVVSMQSSWVDGPASGLAAPQVPVQEVLARHGRVLQGHYAAEGAYAGTSPALLLRVAALLHDIGKPVVAGSGLLGTDAGRGGHDRVGGAMSGAIALRLGLDPAAASRVERIVGAHSRPLALAREGLTEKSIETYWRELGGLGLDVALLSLADNACKAAAPGDRLATVSKAASRLIEAWRAGAGSVALP